MNQMKNDIKQNKDQHNHSIELFHNDQSQFIEQNQLIRQEQEQHMQQIQQINTQSSNIQQLLGYLLQNYQSSKYIFLIIIIIFGVLLLTNPSELNHKIINNKISLSEICQIKIKKSKQENKESLYGFNQQIQDMIDLQQFNDFFLSSQAKKYNYNKDKVIEKMQMMQLTHNVNFNGQLQLQLLQYNQDYSNCSSKSIQTLKNRYKKFQRLLQIQKKDYQKKYNISKYRSQQLSMCIIIPSYNNAHNQLYLRNLDSIFMQDYNNYHIVYIDDASPDKTGQMVQEYIKKQKIPQQKIKVIINQKNEKALANIYKGIHENCFDGQIVAIIDGDDAFIGRQVLSLYNSLYQQKMVGLIYSSFALVRNNHNFFDFLNINKNKRSICFPPITNSIPDYILENGNVRKQNINQFNYKYRTLHLQTFYYNVFCKIKKSDLQDQKGQFFDVDYDLVIFTPIIEMLREKIYFAQEITYQYRYDTNSNDQYQRQRQIRNYYLSKYSQYQALKQDQLQFLKNKKLKNVTKMN